MATDPGSILRSYPDAGDGGDLSALAHWLREGVTVHTRGAVTSVGIAAQVAAWAASEASLDAVSSGVPTASSSGSSTSTSRDLMHRVVMEFEPQKTRAHLTASSKWFPFFWSSIDSCAPHEACTTESAFTRVL